MQGDHVHKTFQFPKQQNKNCSKCCTRKKTKTKDAGLLDSLQPQSKAAINLIIVSD
jgi:hypothetical protein